MPSGAGSHPEEVPERRSLTADAAQDTAAAPGGRPGERRDTGGTYGPAGILALQRSAGNHATAALVQRKVETPGGAMGKARPGFANEFLLDMAAGAIDNPVHRKCVYHYGRNNGALLKLGVDDLRAMNLRFSVLAWPEVTAASKMAELKLREAHRDPEREQAGLPPVIPPGAEESQAVAASGGAIANGSLAGCTAHIEGRMIASASGVRFEGTVHVTDRWDFDPAWLTSENKSHRTWMGELQTNVGWLLLPGEPFPIDTETVPVRQDPGTGRAELQL